VIPHSQFTRIADEHEVDAKTVERDYVLTHVVAAVGTYSADQGLVFKGGTALRLCYFENYRYSADLDFSLLADGDPKTALKSVAQALASVADQIALPHLALTDDGKGIEYEGPLGRRRRIKLDIATDELVEESESRVLLPRYGDQGTAEIEVYTLGEIAAEKLRCVIQRLQTRDLFDLNELFVVNEIAAEKVWPSFERKARHKQIEPSKFAERFEKRVPQWRAGWDAEMAEHLGGEPDRFETVERAVRRALRSHLTAA
jgi:predicted nucleotidyltransferase component of viral defense system